MKPITLALTLALATMASPATAKPLCTAVTPGPAQGAMVPWNYGGKALLKIPANWDTTAAYKELESYGYCTTKAQPPAPAQDAPDATPKPQVRSSQEIIKERVERAKNEPRQDKNSWPTLIFIGLILWAIFSTTKEDSDDPLKKIKREKGELPIFSGVTEPSPWLADQKAPITPSPYLSEVMPRSTQQATQGAPDSTPEPAPTHTPEPHGSQGFGAKFGEGSEPGSEPGSEKVRELSPDQARQAFLADSPYCIHDDDCFVMAVIRLGLIAKLKKAEIQNAFFWLKPEGPDSYKRSPITKGGNEPYERFTELFSEVQSS